MRVRNSLSEGLHRRDISRQARLRKVDQTLELVGLSASDGDRFPEDFSGGQQQRIAIARAIIGGPRLIVFDEAVSSLDVSTQSQVKSLIKDLRDELDLTYVFITHDLAVANHACERIAVMRTGEIVEEGNMVEVIANPSHSYTRDLLSSVLQLPSTA